MSNTYILKGKETVKCDDMREWAREYEKTDRHVASTEQDGILVSTVFLGIDHGYHEGKPILFETMIFGGEHDQDQWRYSTWDEAAIGHAEACKLAGI